MALRIEDQMEQPVNEIKEEGHLKPSKPMLELRGQKIRSYQSKGFMSPGRALNERSPLTVQFKKTGAEISKHLDSYLGQMETEVSTLGEKLRGLVSGWGLDHTSLIKEARDLDSLQRCSLEEKLEDLEDALGEKLEDLVDSLNGKKLSEAQKQEILDQNQRFDDARDVWFEIRDLFVQQDYLKRVQRNLVSTELYPLTYNDLRLLKF